MGWEQGWNFPLPVPPPSPALDSRLPPLILLRDDFESRAETGSEHSLSQISKQLVSTTEKILKQKNVVV